MNSIKNLTLGPIQVTNLTQRTISILGGKGTGKTTTLKMLMAQAAALDLPCYLFDTMDVIRVKDFKVIRITKAHLAAGAQAAQALNQVTDKHIIFSFHELLQKEIVQFTNGFFEKWRVHDAIIGLDEVHEYVPESGTNEGYASEVERAIRHWRNRNVGFIIDSQRPANVDKNVLALTDYAIIYRTTWPQDLDAIEKVLKRVDINQAKIVMSKIQTRPFLNGWAVNFQPGAPNG